MKNNLPLRKFALANVYALRAIGDGYDVYTSAGIFRNVQGSLVRGYFPNGIAWLTEQKLLRPQETMFYVCCGMALAMLRRKCDLGLAEKERRAAEKRRQRTEALTAKLDGDSVGARRLLTAIRANLLDKTVSACIV